MTEPTAPIESNPPTSTNISQPPVPAPATETKTKTETETETGLSYQYPRITIQYCTQCKWMLRAAYFSQELLSTFGTDLGEVALIPRTGGVFTVTIFSLLGSSSSPSGEGKGGNGTILWDRKKDGGFPEVKVLKSRVRNVIDPSRDLGHTDRALRKEKKDATAPAPGSAESGTTIDQAGSKTCEDCQ
ncbi:Rdx family-domain-containing protein [Aspergillus cavernicola]|uniref:Rdx family-domain-containing protein n=1 Tax=Aspergillus cavernicola TaxID=176166 RepID=A0ABR4I5Y3_9EURO